MKLPSFEQEVQSMVKAMQEHSKAVMVGIEVDHEVHDYLQSLYNKGYNSVYVNSIVRAASLQALSEVDNSTDSLAEKDKKPGARHQANG